MKKVNLVTHHELVRYAESLGFEYEDARIILDDFRPEYEVHTLEFSIEDFGKKETDEDFDDFNDIEYSDEANRIMISFFEKNKIKKLVVTK